MKNQNLKDQNTNEEYFISKGWEIYQKIMEPDEPDRVRFIEWWLRLDGIPTKELIRMEWNFRYETVEICRDKSYIRNIPLFNGNISTVSQFETLFDMIDTQIPANIN